MGNPQTEVHYGCGTIRLLNVAAQMTGYSVKAMERKIERGTFKFEEEFPEYRCKGALPSGPVANIPETCSQIFDKFLAHCEHRVSMDDMALSTLNGYRDILDRVFRPDIGPEVFDSIVYTRLAEMVALNTKDVKKKTYNNVTSAIRPAFKFGYKDRPGQFNPTLALSTFRITSRDQRAAVGRALVRQPAACLMDEPLSNLDAKLRVQMRAEIRDLHQKVRTTFIYVTHDQTEAMTMSDRVAVMLDGELLQVAPPHVIYSQPDDLRVAEFIGSPKINLIPAKIRAADSVELAGTSCPLATCLEPESTLTLGVRPESFRLCEPRTPGSLLGLVKQVENQGSDLFAHLEMPNVPGLVVVRMLTSEASRIQRGSSLCVAMNLEQVLLFDAAGKRIRPVGQKASSLRLMTS